MAPTGTAATEPDAFNERDPTEISLRKLIGKIAQATTRSDESAEIDMLRTNKQYDSDESHPNIDENAHHVYPTITVTIENIGKVTVHPNIHQADDEIEFFGYAAELDLSNVDTAQKQTLPLKPIGYDNVTYRENSITARTQSTVAFSQALNILVETVDELRFHR